MLSRIDIQPFLARYLGIHFACGFQGPREAGLSFEFFIALSQTFCHFLATRFLSFSESYFFADIFRSQLFIIASSFIDILL